jgi:capsular exopolysaccharide synthesis family protein
MIARPNSSPKPVAPKSTLILLGFFLVGFSFPGIGLFLRNFFQTRIEGIQELEKLRNVKVVGDVIKSESMNGRSELLVKPNDDTIITEMFRTLRNNLLFMLSGKEQKVVLVTSTVPKEGKTFICSNLARSLSLMDKKVLLMGADLRNPQIAQTLGLNLNGRGLSSYLAGQIDDLDTLLEEAFPNFYVLQAGPVPPNPNELLSNEQVGQILTQLRAQFDYILIDSAPVGVVSDTFLLTPFVDATLYVVREGFSQKDSITFINNITFDKRLRNVGVVLNSASMQKNNGRYRYGHGYGYGAEVL